MTRTRRSKGENDVGLTPKALAEAVWRIESLASDVQAAAKVVRLCLDADDMRGAVRAGNLLFDWTRRLNLIAHESTRATRSTALRRARALIAEIGEAPKS